MALHGYYLITAHCIGWIGNSLRKVYTSCLIRGSRHSLRTSEFLIISNHGNTDYQYNINIKRGISGYKRYMQLLQDLNRILGKPLLVVALSALVAKYGWINRGAIAVAASGLLT
jgi:hypothetical protein